MYKEQSVKDIRYLFSTTTPKLKLTEYKKAQYKNKFIQFNVSILGESHKLEVIVENLVNLKHQDNYTEIVACLEGMPKNSLPANAKQELRNSTYFFKSKVFPLSGDNIKNMPTLINITGKETELLNVDYVFDTQHKYKAITAIVIKQVGYDYLVKTLHTYPNENTMLITETLIKIKNLIMPTLIKKGV